MNKSGKTSEMNKTTKTSKTSKTNEIRKTSKMSKTSKTGKWAKIFQYNSIALFFQAKLIINILVFCHWVLSKINTNSEETLNKISIIFFY